MGEFEATGRGGLEWMAREARLGRMSRREFIQMSLAAGLSMMLAETAFTKALAAAPQKGGSLRVGISWGATSNTLDPGAILDSYMGTVNLTIRSLLTQVDEHGNIINDLAESYEPSNGAK